MPQLDLSLRGLSASRTVEQEAHGLSEFDIVAVDGDGLYFGAQADDIATSEVVGWVQKVHNDDRITVCHMGLISGLEELVPGQAYFLSTTVAGAYQEEAPDGEGEVSKPIFVALTETLAIWTNQRGQVI